MIPRILRRLHTTTVALICMIAWFALVMIVALALHPPAVIALRWLTL